MAMSKRSSRRHQQTPKTSTDASHTSQQDPVQDTDFNLLRLYSTSAQAGWREATTPKEKTYWNGGGTAWLYPELPWGAPPEWGQKSSTGPQFLAFWDIMSFICCLYVAATVPYLVAFNTAREFEDGCIFHDRGYSDIKAGLSIANVIVDFVFTVDMVLNFHTARWVLSKVGTPHWVLVDDLASIRRMYLCGPFLSDAVGQIPWQYLDCLFPNMNESLKMLRLLRLLKLFRLYRVRRMIQALYRKYPKSEVLITALELVLTLCIFAHWMSCLWYSIGYPDGWVFVEGMVDEHGHWLHPNFHAYITSFYWAITTMSTIGYGDIPASTTKERTVASLVMVAGCAYFAWATGRLVQILTKNSKCSSDFESKMEELNEYLEARDISSGLVEKAKNFYMLKYPTLRIFNEQAILEDMPGEVRKGVQLELFQDVVSMAPIFSLCSTQIQRELCYHLQSKYYEAGAMIMEEGSVPDAMYVVRFGFVKVTSQGQEVMLAKRGDVLGENALCGLSEIRRRRRTARAKTECELCVLSKESLEHILIEYPEMQTIFRKVAHMKISDLETAVGQKRGLSIKDFTCADWQKYSVVIRESLRNEETLGPSKAQAATRPGSRGGLETRIVLNFHALQGVAEGDRRTGLVFVVATCRDQLEDKEADCVGETKVFELLVGRERQELDATLTMTLSHKSNDWARMPEMELTAYQPPEHIKQVKMAGSWRTEALASIALEGMVRHGATPRDQHAEATGVYAGCTKLWHGSLSMATVVRQRRQGGAESEIEVVLHPGAARTSRARLVFSSVIERSIPRESCWNRVIPALRQHGKTAIGGYFSKRQDQMLASMKKGIEGFSKHLRTLRARKKQQEAFHTAPSSTAEELQALKTKVSDLEKQLHHNCGEILRCVQGNAHGAHATTADERQHERPRRCGDAALKQSGDKPNGDHGGSLARAPFSPASLSLASIPPCSVKEPPEVGAADVMHPRSILDDGAEACEQPPAQPDALEAQLPPPKPPRRAEDEEEERRAWRREMAAVREENRELRELLAQVLGALRQQTPPQPPSAAGLTTPQPTEPTGRASVRRQSMADSAASESTPRGLLCAPEGG